MFCFILKHVNYSIAQLTQLARDASVRRWHRSSATFGLYLFIADDSVWLWLTGSDSACPLVYSASAAWSVSEEAAVRNIRNMGGGKEQHTRSPDTAGLLKQAEETARRPAGRCPRYSLSTLQQTAIMFAGFGAGRPVVYPKKTYNMANAVYLQIALHKSCKNKYCSVVVVC